MNRHSEPSSSAAQSLQCGNSGQPIAWAGLSPSQAHRLEHAYVRLADQVRVLDSSFEGPMDEWSQVLWYDHGPVCGLSIPPIESALKQRNSRPRD